MPIAPRQGRKGGKISSSAVAGSSDSPSTVSPSSLLPGGAVSLLPTDPAAALQFNIEALIGKKKRSPSKSTAAPGSPDGDGTANSSTTAPAPAITDTNVFKFDLTAIEQVGQGVVFGGNKSMRTDTRRPNIDKDAVVGRLRSLISSQKPTDNGSAGMKKETDDVVEKFKSHQIVLLQRPHAALRLAASLNSKEGVKVLVVVPRHSHVEEVAEALRQVSKTGSSAGTGSSVGCITGQTFLGEATTTLWVTDVGSALVYLTAQRGMAPFTHIVLPNLCRLSPLLSFFLWGVRERVLRQSPNCDPTAPRLHLAVCIYPSIEEKVKQFFSSQSVLVVPAVPVEPLTEFSYDEANALAQRDVLEVEIDRTGKALGPHRKLTEHTLQLAIGIIREAVSSASHPQFIYVFSGDVREVADALAKEQFGDVTVFNGESPVNQEESTATVATKHRIYVLHSVVSFTTYSNEDATLVLDMGTTRRAAAQSKSESFMVSMIPVWASRMDIVERKQLTGSRVPGGYFALYPSSAEAAFQAAEPSQPTLFDMDDALLQCSRADIPVMHANKDAILPIDDDSTEQVCHNLGEKSLISSVSDYGLTFTGEMASRLPLDIDFSHFLISGCAIGFGEVAVVMTGVCAVPFLFPRGESTEELMVGRQAIDTCRAKYAKGISSQSDVLADVLIFIEWWKLKVKGVATEAFFTDVPAREERLEEVRTLIEYLRVEMSDYVFIDDLNSLTALESMTQCIRQHASIFVFLKAVSFTRRLLFVRDAGAMNRRARAGALVFVRTAKKVVPNSHASSSVAWEPGSALVAVNLRSHATNILCSNMSVVNTTYLFAALLLLYPQVEYSAPAEVPGRGNRVVYFGLTCNRQMKRFRVSIEEAAQILDFREKWNRLLGYMQALRTSKRPLSRRRFDLALKEGDRHFSLEEYRASVQRDLLDNVTEIEVTEHQASFVTQGIHCWTPKEMLEPVAGVDASDVEAIKNFRSGEMWISMAHARVAESPATLRSDTRNMSPVVVFPSGDTIIDDDEDDVEVMEELYFKAHGPIIDDDTDDDD